MIRVVKAAAVCIFNSVNDCYPKRMFGCNVGFLGDSTFVFTRGVVAYWLQRLTSKRSGVSSNPLKVPVVSLCEKRYHHYPVLFCSRDVFL